VLWLGALPDTIRKRFLLPPLDADLPASFLDREGFAALVDDHTSFVTEAAKLMRVLARFAQPFDPHLFEEELGRLAEQ
jgi:hypothetical protein